MATTEHHTVIIVGGGPAGLPLAIVLGGWHPFYKNSSTLFQERYPNLDSYLSSCETSLLGLDFNQLLRKGILPLDLFRLLHHPSQKFRGLEEIALEFHPKEALDYLLISREPVGGLWNNVPENLLTLSPGQWMEFAFYPLAKYIEEKKIPIDVNDLILKRNLLDYYHRVPGYFGQSDHIRTQENIVRIEPHEMGFLLTAQDIVRKTTTCYTCKYLIYAAGQRSIKRSLNIPGENLPFVIDQYTKPEDFPGKQIIIVGGGRSADWAATELHDAEKQIYYIMRQPSQRHWKLINDSRWLPYYARLANIIESRSPNFQTIYQSCVQKIEENGLVTFTTNGQEHNLKVDQVILEIGGVADYSLFKGFPPFQITEKYDQYRFQVHQLATHPHNHESIDIPNLYAGGYLAQGLGLVVIAMHGSTYAIAGDILQKENRV